MENSFWHARWEEQQIGFHQSEVNAYLSGHWGELGLPHGAPVFVPLCGKSLDMLWLREQGHPVLGIELSPKAVDAFFRENGLSAHVDAGAPFIAYHGDRINLLAGDFFKLTKADLVGIYAVYDRASLVALPAAMRREYVQHMARLLPSGAHILLVTMEYEAGTLEGPPFCVSEDEVKQLYQRAFTVERMGVFDGTGPKGVAVTEKVYRITRL